MNFVVKLSTCEFQIAPLDSEKPKYYRMKSVFYLDFRNMPKTEPTDRNIYCNLMQVSGKA